MAPLGFEHRVCSSTALPSLKKVPGGQNGIGFWIWEKEKGGVAGSKWEFPSGGKGVKAR